MSDRDYKLHLVLNKSGEEPLVLSSWWNGRPSRPRPHFENLGRATDRLRAVCILLLLSKFHEIPKERADEMPLQKSDGATPNLREPTESSKAPLVFRASRKYQQWIHTLAHADLASLKEWLATRFRVSEIFLKPYYGTMHNKGGRNPAHIEFLSERLPLSNLSIYWNSENAADSDKQLLSGPNLVAFAYTLEQKHWKKHSAIVARYGNLLVKMGMIPASVNNVTTPSTSHAVTQYGLASSTQKSDFDHLFQLSIEKEIAEYRQVSRPCFAYIQDSLKSRPIYSPWRNSAWNARQAKALVFNCAYLLMIPNTELSYLPVNLDEHCIEFRINNGYIL